MSDLAYKSGSLVLHSGSLATNCACCPTITYGGDCSNCAAGATPLKWLITFDGGWNHCGCVSLAASSVNWDTGSLASQSVCAVHTFLGNCIWSKTIANTIKYKSYSNTTCTGGGSAVFNNVGVTLQRTATQWILRADYGPDSLANTIIFTSTISSVGTDCSSVLTFTNDKSTSGDCAGGGTNYVGYGGTATATPGGC